MHLDQAIEHRQLGLIHLPGLEDLLQAQERHEITGDRSSGTAERIGRTNERQIEDRIERQAKPGCRPCRWIAQQLDLAQGLPALERVRVGLDDPPRVVLSEPDQRAGRVSPAR